MPYTLVWGDDNLSKGHGDAFFKSSWRNWSRWSDVSDADQILHGIGSVLDHRHVAAVCPHFDRGHSLYFSGINRCHVAASPIHAFHCENGVVAKWLCIYVRHETAHPRFWRDEFSIVGSDGHPLSNLPKPKRADAQLFFGNRPHDHLVGQSFGRSFIFGTKRTRNRHHLNLHCAHYHHSLISTDHDADDLIHLDLSEIWGWIKGRGKQIGNRKQSEVRIFGEYEPWNSHPYERHYRYVRIAISRTIGRTK